MQLLLWQYQLSGQPGLALSWSALPTTIFFVFGNLLAAPLSEIRLFFARRILVEHDASDLRFVGILFFGRAC